MIKFLNRGSKAGEIWLYDVVGEDWFGGMSAKQFGVELNALGAVDTINLRINSPGGDVFDGFAIYNQLARHPARVVVDVDGLAASIASVIAMAGDEIRMAKNAQVMIHNPHGVAVGDAMEMRRTAELLDRVREGIVTTYHDRTGSDRDRLLAWMEAETWFSADEAVSAGLADSVTEELKVAACAVPSVLRFKNAHGRTGEPARPAYDMAAVRLAAMRTKIAGIASA